MKSVNQEALDVLADYYYPRAKWLQMNCNWGNQSYTSETADSVVNDQLMQNIEIYDCYTRNAAGFSNALQDLWHKTNTPKWHHMDEERKDFIRMFDTSYWDLDTWLWVFMFHRNTGSGASFQDDHGYRNCLTPWFGTCINLPDMLNMVRRTRDSGQAMFTSIGNQPPAPKKGTSNIDFLLVEAPTLCDRLARWLEKKRRTHKEVVDFLNVYNVDKGHRRFNFQYAALSMDISDYFPDLVDPESHTYLGNNAKRCGKLIFKGYKDDAFMDVIQEAMGGLHKDNEDVLCDFVRFGQNYDPWKRGEYRNNSGWISGWDERSN